MHYIESRAFKAMLRNAVIFFLMLIVQSTQLHAEQDFRIDKGELDLTRWDPKEQPVISLAGEWKFYWNELLTAKEALSRKYEYAQVSIPWSEQEINGKQYTRNGFATYVLKIILPDNVNTVSFWIPAVFNSSSLWINDTQIVTSGTVGRDKDSMIPLWKPNVATVRVTKPFLYVCFQIANFQGTRGGCAEVPKLSEAPYLKEVYDREVFTGKSLIAIFAVIAIIGLIVFYAMGVSSYLAISLVAAAFIVRFLFSDHYLIYELGAQFPWYMMIKLEYCSISIVILSSTYFIRLIYPIEFSKIMSVLFSVTCLLLLAATIILPFHLLSELLVVLQLIGLAFAVVIFITIVRALIRKRRGAWLSGFSFLCFAGIGFYNIYAFLFVMDLNRTLIHAGYTIALLLSVISLGMRTPIRLKEEEFAMMKYEDFYKT